MATTSEKLDIAQLRQEVITKEQKIEVLTGRIKILRIEIADTYDKIKQLEDKL